MGNKTTVTTISIAGALTALFLWVIGYFYPEFMSTAPAGAESILTVLFAGILGFFKEEKA